MEKEYKILKDLLLEKYPYCEVCNINLMTDVGHCLYHIHGGIYDSYENCQSNCNPCNTGHGENANSRKAKKAHWKKRSKELGKEHMNTWNNKVPKWRRDGFE